MPKASISPLSPSLKAPHSVINQCAPPPDQIDSTPALRSALELINRLDGRYQLLARLMLFAGCRLQEALNIQYADVDVNGFILIRALKRSTSRVVYFPDILSLINPAIPDRTRRVFHNIDRWRFYRAIDSTGFNRFQHSRIRRKLGNLFRSAAAQACYTLDGGHRQCATEFLGHKNPASTLFYTNKGR